MYNIGKKPIPNVHNVNYTRQATMQQINTWVHNNTIQYNSRKDFRYKMLLDIFFRLPFYNENDPTRGETARGGGLDVGDLSTARNQLQGLLNILQAWKCLQGIMKCLEGFGWPCTVKCCCDFSMMCAIPTYLDVFQTWCSSLVNLCCKYMKQWIEYSYCLRNRNCDLLDTGYTSDNWEQQSQHS